MIVPGIEIILVPGLQPGSTANSDAIGQLPLRETNITI
jgi:hypothetical protein